MPRMPANASLNDDEDGGARCRSNGKPRANQCWTSAIGLNSGPASVGNMGSALRLMDIRASRRHGKSVLGGWRAEQGSMVRHILVNESTVRPRVKDDGFLFRELDIIRVNKGKLQPVMIYELVGKLFGTESRTPSSWNCRNGFAEFPPQREELLSQARLGNKAQHAFQDILDRTAR